MRRQWWWSWPTRCCLPAARQPQPPGRRPQAPATRRRQARAATTTTAAGRYCRRRLFCSFCPLPSPPPPIPSSPIALFALRRECPEEMLLRVHLLVHHARERFSALRSLPGAKEAAAPHRVSRFLGPRAAKQHAWRRQAAAHPDQSLLPSMQRRRACAQGAAPLSAPRRRCQAPPPP